MWEKVESCNFSISLGFKTWGSKFCCGGEGEHHYRDKHHIEGQHHYRDEHHTDGSEEANGKTCPTSLYNNGEQVLQSLAHLA